MQVCKEDVHMMGILGVEVLDSVFILIAYAMGMITVEMAVMKRTVVGKLMFTNILLSYIYIYTRII